MAMAKRKPRTASRSRKRAPAKKSGSSSLASVLALGAIVAVGAVSLWAVSQHKSPQTAISGLFNDGSSSNRSSNSAAPRSVVALEKKEPAAQPSRMSRSDKKPSTQAMATAPIPRPEAGLGATKIAQTPPPTARPQVATTATPAARPNQRPNPRPDQRIAAVTLPPAASQNLPPRGVNRPDSTPTMVYAKHKLTVHKTAWDKSPSMGEVEKGRELRSYGQTGKWHRVVVPATDMIGWVHQDMLMIVKNSGNQNAQAPASITTGSIKAATPARPLPFAAKTASSHPVPKSNVGN